MSDALSGTIAQNGGDSAGTLGTGTSDATGANAGDLSVEQLQAENERLRRAHEQSLAEKDTLERTKRENAELRARLSAPPTGAGAGGYGPDLDAQAAWNARMMEHQIAARENPRGDSAQLVGLFAQNQYLVQEIQTLKGLIGTPAEKQTQVRDLQNEYEALGERISAKTASELLEARALSAKQVQVDATAREQEAAEAARQRGVVGTRTVGVSRSEIEGKEITMAEFERRTANMSASEARAFDAELVTKGIRVGLE